MNLTIALIESGQLETVWDYGDFESWSDYDRFVEQNLFDESNRKSICDNHRELVLWLSIGGRAVHADYFDGQALVNQF